MSDQTEMQRSRHVQLFHFLLMAIIVWLACIHCVSTANASPLDSISPEFPSDTVSEPSDSTIHQSDTIITAKRSDNPNWWWNRLRNGTLVMKDTSVIYPRFLGFCVNVYNWADRTFNSYDSEYVEGTGKRWKAIVKSDNWSDGYAMNLRHDMPITMTSDIYCSLGFYLQYMAVSVGYSLDMSNIIGNKPMLHKKFGAGFNCSLFSIEVYYHENTGGAFLRTFGDYKKGKWLHEEFPGVSVIKYGVDAYYFFNHNRYSQGAAYNFSKYQRKSAGSFIIGFNYGNHNISLDFERLPENLLPYLNIPNQKYRFHYHNFCLMGGYGYNFVFAKNWILNATAMPMVGLNRSFLDSLEGKQDMLSLGVKAKTALTWNIQNFFLSVQAVFDGSWYRSSDYSLFSTFDHFSANVGVRF